LYRVTLHPLASYPGPKSWAASRIPFVIFSTRGTLHYKIAELHEKYGPVVRIAPNELSYTSEDAWTDIYHTSRPQLKKDPAIGTVARNKKNYTGGDTLPEDKDHLIRGIILTEDDDDHARIRYGTALQ